MKKLRIILRSNIFILVLIIITLISILLSSIKERKSKYFGNEKKFICIIENIKNNRKIDLDCGEKIDGIGINDINNTHIGDIIEIKGYLKEYDNNTNFNQFNYKDYKKLNNIYFKLYIDSYKVIGESKSIILNIKRKIDDRIKYLKSYNYLKVFLLGDKSEIDNDQVSTYKNLGIIHLFSISGMHLSLLLELIEFIYKKNNIKRSIITIILLFIYYLIVHTVSLLRCIIFFIIKKINQLLLINLNRKKELAISVMTLIIIKPTLIYNLGFYYSTILSIAISLYYRKINNLKSQFLKSFYISIIAFLFSLPLNLYINFEVNILSIINNIIFIPLITTILFPLSLLTLLFPFLDDLLYLSMNIIEKISNLLVNNSFTFIFKKPDLLLIIIYYFVISLVINNKKYLIFLIALLLIHYNINVFIKESFLLAFDVGQGDSLLIHSNNKDILIDTGGTYSNYNMAKNILIPTIKSFGIRKVDTLIITHGDFDHMGEAINLVNNFKVEKVIFNCGPYNDLEKELIKVLDKKKIKYYSCIKELNIDKNKLYFLQTKVYDNENDNSNVIYTELNGYKFMFMGDASVTTEKEIIQKYNLPDIDVLKVGHHGSKTSSGIDFINEINPKYSVISVGKENRYGHPNKEVLNVLEDTKIYRTDQDGSIMFKIKNNKLIIETCSP